MSDPIVYLDRSVIRSPDVDGLRAAVDALVEFVRERQPQLLFYGFEIDEPAATMSLVAVHPDSESLERHLGVGGPAFRKVGAFIDVQQIDLYGKPSESALDGVRQKAAMLGTNAAVRVHELASSFERLSAGRH